LQSANVTRQLLHRAESLVHLLKSIAHQLERFPEAFFQCPLQFFIDGRAHLVDLLCIVLLSCRSRSSTIERTLSRDLVSSSRWFFAAAPASSRLRENSSRNPRSIVSNRFTSSAGVPPSFPRRVSKTITVTMNAPPIDPITTYSSGLMLNS